MKKFLLAAALVAVSMGFLASQDHPKSSSGLLVVYEESNSNIDPWVALFKEELKSRNIEADFLAVAEAKAKGVSAYERIIVFGSYMAFGMKEPARDWLKAKVDLSGKKVRVFVTAGSSNPKKYSDQLAKLAKGRKAEVVDAVSSATKNMSDEDKRKAVKDFLSRVE